MARNSRRGASRRRRVGGASYARPQTETISVLRLYASDYPELDFDKLSAADIANAIAIDRLYAFRLLAVCFAGLSGYTIVGSTNINGASNTVLEFRGGLGSFSLNNMSTKPARVRVPQKNYVVNQWYQVKTDGTTRTITPNVPISGDLNSPMYTVQSNSRGTTDNTNLDFVQFIDVAIHY